jgi:hypothetical protein
MEYTEEDSETQIETEDGEEAWVATHSGRGMLRCISIIYIC